MNVMNLPLAEKTNIKNWAFEALVLKELVSSTIDGTGVETKDNQLVIVDGYMVYNTLPSSLKIKVGVDDKKFYKEDATKNKLLNLNVQARNSVLEMVVEKNTHVMEDISVVVVGKDQSLIHETKLTLETGASLNLVETYVNVESFNANIVSELKVGENAKLVMNTVSDMKHHSVVYHHKHTEIERDGVLDATNFIINDANMVFEDFTHLLGPGSEVDVKTVSIASGHQQQNITVRTENIAGHTVANIVNYGIVKDEAHLAFNGVGKIEKAAKESDNQQETRLLNLSKTAEAVANPFLLIDEGDITAGHAASIGQLDEEQIYYLMSRGMSKSEASKMIVSGFLAPFVDVIDDEGMKETLSAKMEKKLG